MSLDATINEQIFGLKTTPSTEQPDEQTSLIIKDVAEPSIAHRAGISAGERLVTIDHSPATFVNLAQLSHDQRVRYEFYSPTEETTTELFTFGGPIGITTELSTKAVLAQLDPVTNNVTSLDLLWERGDWRELAKGARVFARPGLFYRCLWVLARLSYGKQVPMIGDTPATALLGAALYEQGKKSKGLALLKRYQRDFEDGWTTQYHGLVRYYLALDELERGNRGRAIELLHASFGYSANRRAADKLEALTDQRPVARKLWEERYLPLDYALPRLDGDGTVTLSEVLSQLGPHQTLALCLLGSYRANGPYNDFIERFAHLHRTFPQRLVGLHVVTMQPQASHDTWLANEQEARRLKLPIELLYDRDGQATFPFGASHSPYVLFMTNFGGVVFEGTPDDVEWWTLLSRLEQLSEQRREDADVVLN